MLHGLIPSTVYLYNAAPLLFLHGLLYCQQNSGEYDDDIVNDTYEKSVIETNMVVSFIEFKFSDDFRTFCV